MNKTVSLMLIIMMILVMCSGAIAMADMASVNSSYLGKELGGTVIIDTGAPTGAPKGETTTSAGGGTWTYGTSINLSKLTKSAYSIYNHKTRSHRSSVRVGSNYNYSPYESPKNASFASVVGPMTSDSQAWWSLNSF